MCCTRVHSVKRWIFYYGVMRLTGGLKPACEADSFYYTLIIGKPLSC